MKAFFYFLLISIPFQLHAQSVSFLQEMQQDNATDIYLQLDWKNLEKHKKDKVYQTSSVCCTAPSKDSLILNCKVRTRGHMRLEICDYPPLKLKFDKADLVKYHLSSFNEMDIVNHCEQSDAYDQLVLKEYLAYQLWEIISPHYFKTKLIRLHYLDMDGVEVHSTSPGFLVEDIEELCDRLGARDVKNKVISKAAIDRQPFLRLCLFEFMIGNTDWYIANRHNIEFVGIPGYKLLVTIPFDFDYSGLVHAPYAAPNEAIEFTDVAIRYYQGWCHTEAEVREQLQIFLDQKEKILSMPYQIQGLNAKSTHQAVEYLQDFFDIIENPKKLDNMVLRHCDLWGN